MYQFPGSEDTIAAIATPPGEGGIGIVRLSGPQAIAVSDRLFISAKGRKPSSFKNFTAYYGWVKNPQDSATIDEALLTIMRAPHSYTKEDVAEISCHGGGIVLNAILTLVLESGARLAEPGEFTKRAFLNGRIDLAQAEAVLDIIRSKTEKFLRISHNQLKGELSRQLESIREKLMNIYTEIEAIVNFPEDGLETRGRETIAQLLKASYEEICTLVASGEQGKILREGIKIVLCGRPNVGKSSLLNALLRQPRAIVTDIAGTTRDTIEETAQIRGIPFQLVDTAGILEPRDLIEEEAIKRSRMYMARADLILLILDGSQEFSAEDKELVHKLKGKNTLLVINKCDLKGRLDESILKKEFPGGKIFRISALQQTGLDELENSIVDYVWHGHAEPGSDILVTNVRHLHALKNCRENLEKSNQVLNDRLSLEFASEEIKSAVNALDSITGRNIDADLLEKIFSSFCIGK